MFRRQDDNGDNEVVWIASLGRVMLALAMPLCLSLVSAMPARAFAGGPAAPAPATYGIDRTADHDGGLASSVAPGHEVPWLLELMQRITKVLDQVIDFVAAFVPVSSSNVAPASTVAEPRPASAALTVEQVEASLVAQTNAARESAGLPPLQVDATLTLLARQRSQDMIDRDYFSHTDPESGTSLVGPYCIVPLNVAYCGENLAGAAGLEDAQASVVSRWLASGGHRENILRAEFGRVGIGVAVGGRWGAVVTQLFAP
jgi:uncharacterized protein YkwD